MQGTIPNSLISSAKKWTSRNQSFSPTHVILTHNRLSGTLPAGSTILDCDTLFLADSLLCVTVGSEIKDLVVSQNILSGTLETTGALSKLHRLIASQNRISGTISKGIETAYNLSALVLHSNSFEGRMPSITQLYELVNLTLFSNRLFGKLALAPNTTMHILFTQSNRLSCPIEGVSLNPLHPQSVYDTQATLVLPGNTFTGMQRTIITQSALSYHSVTTQTTLNQSSVNKPVCADCVKNDCLQDLFPSGLRHARLNFSL